MNTEPGNWESGKADDTKGDYLRKGITMEDKLLFIYNPYAGKGQIKNKLWEIIDVFVKSHYDVTVYPTQYYQDGMRKVKEESSEYSRIVCSGGDGTLNEIISGMMEAEHKIPIGYIPTGSTNDFSTSLGIPKQMYQAARVAAGENILKSDIGTLNGRYFVYVAAFGLFTDVSYQTKQELKQVLGHSAYVLEGMKRLYHIPSYPLKVEYDDNVLNGDYIYGMVTNSVSVGGFKNLTGKNVQLDDGLYEVTMIRRPENPLQLNEVIASILTGDLKAANIDSFKASKLKITCEEEIPWTVDGEFGGKHLQVDLINHKQAVEILVP